MASNNGDIWPRMLVISTHGIYGWRPLVFGSIAEKVVKLVQCPLLLLRSVSSEASASTENGARSEIGAAKA